MIIKTYSYRFAEEILSYPTLKSIKDELYDICVKCPVPVYRGKSKTQRNKDVVQQIMNTYFRIKFEEYGWESEPLATPDENEDELRADFRKKFYTDDGKSITIQIEVEFGNIASSYRNYFKFQLSYSYGLTDICVLVVPSQQLANRIDSGVACFEKCKRELVQAKLSVTVPTLVVGLFDRDDMGNLVDEWDIHCYDINVVKNKDNTVKNAHENIVRNYIKGDIYETS